MAIPHCDNCAQGLPCTSKYQLLRRGCASSALCENLQLVSSRLLPSPLWQDARQPPYQRFSFKQMPMTGDAQKQCSATPPQLMKLKLRLHSKSSLMYFKILGTTKQGIHLVAQTWQYGIASILDPFRSTFDNTRMMGPNWNDGPKLDGCHPT